MYALIRIINLFKIHSQKIKAQKNDLFFISSILKCLPCVWMRQIENIRRDTPVNDDCFVLYYIYICVLVANLRFRDKFILSSRSKNWNDKWINRKNIIKLVLFTPFTLWQYFVSRDPVLNFNWSSVSVPCATREAQ